MFSVTSEAATNAAFQAAPQWSARPDQAPANDLFGALVNHNTAADNATAPSPPPPQRRTVDAPAPANNAAAPNTASNQAASNDQNSNANAGPPSDINGNNANNANTGDPSGTGATQPSQTKSTGAPKTDPGKPTDKSASGDTTAVDLTVLAQQAALTATTPNPVAVAIPVTTASTNVPAATTPGNSTAPLAIAAAAIAASTQAVSAQAASSAPIKTDSSTAATDAAAATTTATAATVATTTAKVATSGPAGATVAAPVAPQATQAIATPANAAALTSAAAATAPVAPKPAPGKSPAASTATDGSTTTSGTADASATNAPAGAVQSGLLQQPSTAGKPENTNAAVEAAAADAAASPTSAIAAHEHSPAAGTGHALTDAADPGTQPTGTFQPQPNPPAAAAAPGGAFSVAAATSGPVPLSGLALEIAASVKSGKSRFEIRLDPADLGRIDVRIDIDRNGQVTSHLTVEKPETLSMLRQDAPQLLRALDDAGLKTGSGGLQFSLRDQSSSGQNNGNDTNPNAQRLTISEEDTIPASVAGRTYGRALGPSSGVDIRV